MIYNKYTKIRSFFLWGTPLSHNKIRLVGLSSSTIFKWESNTLFKHFLLPLHLNFASSSYCQSKDCELLLCLRRGWILGVRALASFSPLPNFYRTPITVSRLVSRFSLIHGITHMGSNGSFIINTFASRSGPTASANGGRSQSLLR